MRKQAIEAAWQKRLVRVGEFLEAIEEGRGTEGLEDARVLEVRILTNQRDAGDTLLVIKAREGDQQYVAFVGARNVGEAILTWRQRAGKKGLKWRPDKPWGE